MQRLSGNVGYLDLQPVLFPSAMSGEAITAAMILLSGTDALIIDLRRCLGGGPSTTSLIISYLWTHEPVQLTGCAAAPAPHPARPGRSRTSLAPASAGRSRSTY
jgi:hypothetical protein